MQRTFLIIKPDAVRDGVAGAIRDELERAGFRVVEEAERRLGPGDVAALYEVHRDKPFYSELVDHLSSGVSVGMVLEAPEAVASLRRLTGATDPSEAAPGTLRARFGTSLQLNAVHASDSEERVDYESSIYFGRPTRDAGA